MSLKDTFSKRLRNCFEREDLSQPKAVAKMKEEKGFTLHQTSLGEYMRGDVLPNLEMAINLASYYGVSIDWLTGTSETKETPQSMHQRLIEMAYSPEAQEAATILDELPTDMRDKLIVEIKAAQADHARMIEQNERWQQIEKLITLMDGDSDSIRQPDKSIR